MISFLRTSHVKCVQKNDSSSSILAGHHPLLKAVDTVGNCQRLAFTVGCENLSSIGHWSCEIIMAEKTPLSHEVVCVYMVDFETSSSKTEVTK